MKFGIDADEWLEQLHSAYKERKFDPSELKELVALVDKGKSIDTPGAIEDLNED